MADKIPKLGSYPKGISEVYEMIKDPEYVRETTRIANLKRAIERGTGSTVVRSAGYNKLFETFIKKGISKATINTFKLIPDIADFDDAKDYSDALRKFRNTAFKGLSNKQLGVIESSGFLSQYAKDQRNKLLKSGLKNVKPNLNKILDQLFDYTFITKESAVGVKKPKLQSKIYTQIRDMAKRTLSKAQRLNLDYALSQVDDLFKSGKVVKAAKMLAGISTLVAKGVFGKAIPLAGNLMTTEMGSGELSPEQVEEYKKYQTQARMNKRGGGIMNIDYMTRPVGYDHGGNVTTFKGPDGYRYLLRPDGTVEKIPGQELQAEDIDEILKTFKGPGGNQYLLRPGGAAEKLPGQDEEGLPYDPEIGSTENLNEMMGDIGGTLKEKIFGAGRSLRDKISDFMKYGWGDKEDYMEIGGKQVDPEDPNFIRFIEDNYMGEGESFIEGIENYRREIEGGGFRRGGIVSLNHMTRAL